MRYRRFRVAGGQFLDALLTCEGEFSVSAESHKADHEAGYGVAPLTVVDGDSDPWDGVSALLQRPPRPVPTQAPIGTLTAAEVAALPAQPPGPLATAQAILAKADADITAGEVKALVLMMARYFLRKWLGGWR